MDATSRRRFLQALGVSMAGAALGLPSALGSAAQPAAEEVCTVRTGRQWVMVIDLRQCEGCETIDTPPQCSTSCREAHYLYEGQEWMKVYKVETEWGSYWQPTPCMHCENAPCVKVCPTGASFHTDAGLVLIDNRVCIGCRMCMAACPYGARTFNWTDPPSVPGLSPRDYSPEHSIPQKKGTPSKCMFCAHQIETGELPACASGCPMYAIYFGDLTQDVATNGKEVVRLSEFLPRNHAFQLKAELGTRPRVWYIPGHGEAFGREHNH